MGNHATEIIRSPPSKATNLYTFIDLENPQTCRKVILMCFSKVSKNFQRILRLLNGNSVQL